MTRVREMDNKMRYFSGSFEWLFTNHSVYMTILRPRISYRMSHVLNDVVDCRLLLILTVLSPKKAALGRPQSTVATGCHSARRCRSIISSTGHGKVVT